jgi:predicted nucleotidyltransferase
MRLIPKEVDIIKKVVLSELSDGIIYLFGSRLDESKRGGDIDLFIISKAKSYEKKLHLKAKLKELLHKPVDIVFHSNFDRAIEEEALKGIKL